MPKLLVRDDCTVKCLTTPATRLALLFFSLLVALTNAHAGKTYYVAATGDDANPGTQQQPWRHLNHAIKSTGMGDTVYVRAGAYFEGGEIWFRPGQGGAAGAWKTLKAFPGEDVVLETRLLIEASYVRVQGFRMASGKSIITRRNGAAPASHVEIIDNRLAGFYRYGAIEIAGDDILVEGNEIALDGAGSTLDHGIYVHYGRNKIIRRNRITGPHGYGIHVYEENKYPVSPDINDVIIESNYIASSVARAGIIVTCAQGVKIANVTIRQNVIKNNAQAAIKIASDRVAKVSIINNTFVENREQSIVVEGGREVVIRNNIREKEKNGSAVAQQHRLLRR
jgi:hypothetical protein